jgi:hypothetical protein
MNMSAYLTARGWKLYRKAWDGKAAMWYHPRDNKLFYQRQAIKLERALERKANCDAEVQSVH